MVTAFRTRRIDRSLTNKTSNGGCVSELVTVEATDGNFRSNNHVLLVM